MESTAPFPKGEGRNVQTEKSWAMPRYTMSNRLFNPIMVNTMSKSFASMNATPPWLPLRATLAAIGLTLSTVLAYADEATDLQRLLAAGKYSEAVQKADTALASKPRDPMLRFGRAVALHQMGKTSDAVAAFVKLTEDFPELPEPYNNLAVIYAQQNQYEKARVALEMAIRTNPSYATAYENLGDVYAKLASQSYAKALQIDTRSPVAPKLAMIRDLFPRDRSNNAVAALTGKTPGSNTITAATPTPPPTTKPPVSTTATPGANAKTPTAVTTDSVATREVENRVRAWAQAWSKRDMNGYLNAYSGNYSVGGQSHRAWAAERRDRIMGKSAISVKLSDLQVTVDGDRATAQFLQDYRAGSLASSSRKRLELTRQGGAWVIVKESVGS
jgi:tetratricopeptide (TPR) repeat protein